MEDEITRRFFLFLAHSTERYSIRMHMALRSREAALRTEEDYFGLKGLLRHQKGGGGYFWSFQHAHSGSHAYMRAVLSVVVTNAKTTYPKPSHRQTVLDG